MRPGLRRSAALGAILVSALWAGCEGTGPAGVDGGPTAALHLVARAETPARLPSALRPSSLLIEVRTVGGALVRDSTVQVEAGEELDLDIPLTTVAESQEFLVQLFLRTGTQLEVYRSERTSVVAQDPEEPGDPTEVILLYSGPGAGADHLAIVPGESAVLLGETTTLEARAFSATGEDQGAVPVEWTSLDPDVLSLVDPATGRWQARDRRGVARVTAALDPMGFVDTATVFVNPPAGDLRRAGGNRQDGKAGGRLPNPIRVRVLGTDGLPLGGQEVAFEAGSGGSVSSAVAVTAGDGRAEVEWTLGPTLGEQSLVASVVADPSLTVTFTADATAAALASLSVTPTQVTFDALTDTEQLDVTGRDIFDNEVDPTGVSWASSNTSVATVSSGGRVTAVGNGQAQIRATSEGVTSSPVQVVVNQVPVEARVEPSSGWTLANGDTLLFRGIALDRRDRPIEGAVFQWSSSNTSVLTIGADGRAVGRALGEATVTARLSGDASISATSSGDVGPAGLHSLVVTPGSVSFDAVGATRQLSVEGRDRFGNVVELDQVGWTSGDSDVAVVSASGVLRSVGNGGTTVRATSEGVVSNPVGVEVDQAAVAVTVSPSSGWEVGQGEEIAFTATALDRLDSPIPGRTFQWSSSNADRLEIGPDGTGVGGERGSVTVTAALVGGPSLSASSQGEVVYGPLAELIVTPDPVTIDALGASQLLFVEGRDRFGNVIPVEGLSWTSSNRDVVTVNGEGRLSSKANGTAVVRASAQGVTSNAVDVTVRQVAVGMSVSPASGWVVFERQNIQFSATAFDRLGNPVADADIRWSSSDTGVMTIDDRSGTARARNPGVVTIRAFLAGDDSVNAASVGVVLER